MKRECLLFRRIAVVLLCRLLPIIVDHPARRNQSLQALFRI